MVYFKKPCSLIFIGIFVLFLSGCGYNAIVTLDEGVNAAWAEVENQYERRADLIPNLVQVVKGYASHEKETLQAVVEARAKATQTKIDAGKLSSKEAFSQFQQAQGALSSALSRLMVVVERYPDLKANQNFRDLQAQLEGTENRITVARNRYIQSVQSYNTKIRVFPSNLTAKFLLSAERKETFSTEPEKKEVPNVQF